MSEFCGVPGAPFSHFQFIVHAENQRETFFYNWQKFAQENRVNFVLAGNLSPEEFNSFNKAPAQKIILYLGSGSGLTGPNLDLQFLKSLNQRSALEKSTLVCMAPFINNEQQQQILSTFKEHWTGPCLVLGVVNSYGFLPHSTEYKNESRVLQNATDWVDFLYQIGRSGLPLTEVMSAADLSAPYVPTSIKYAYHVLCTLLVKNVSGSFILSSRGEGCLARLWEVLLHQTQWKPESKPSEANYQQLLQAAQKLRREGALPTLSLGATTYDLTALYTVYPNIVDFHEGFCDYILERLQADV